MNRNLLRALSAAFAVASASLASAQGWVWYCDDPETDDPLYSNTYGGNGVGNDLFAATMAGGGTATYEICWPSEFNGEGAGGLDFNIGRLGSVQTNQDEYTELIMGGGFIDFINPGTGETFYGPRGTRSNFTYAATVRQDTNGDPNLSKWGSDINISTYFSGASDRYLIASGTADNIQVNLRVDSVADAARVQWDLINLGTESNIGLWFGQWVNPIDNYSLNPKPISFVTAPGYKPLTVMRRFQRTPNPDPNLNPREYPLPPHIDFMVSQARAWEGMRIVLDPTTSTGAYPDQTAVDGFDFSNPGSCLAISLATTAFSPMAFSTI